MVWVIIERKKKKIQKKIIPSSMKVLLRSASLESSWNECLNILSLSLSLPLVSWLLIVSSSWYHYWSMTIGLSTYNRWVYSNDLKNIETVFLHTIIYSLLCFFHANLPSHVDDDAHAIISVYINIVCIVILLMHRYFSSSLHDARSRVSPYVSSLSLCLPDAGIQLMHLHRHLINLLELLSLDFASCLSMLRLFV